MLGSVADAEDVVQDAWLRWSAADRERRRRRARLPGADHHPAGARPDGLRPGAAGELRRAVAARAAADRERAGGGGPAGGRSRRTPPSSASRCRWPCWWCSRRCPPPSARCSCCGRCSGCRSAEVAAALDRSEAAVRQMAHRAREHVQARQPRFDTDRREQREVTERFLAAAVERGRREPARRDGARRRPDRRRRRQGHRGPAADRRRGQGGPVPGRRRTAGRRPPRPARGGRRAQRRPGRRRVDRRGAVHGPAARPGRRAGRAGARTSPTPTSWPVSPADL